MLSEIMGIKNGVNLLKYFKEEQKMPSKIDINLYVPNLKRENKINKKHKHKSCLIISNNTIHNFYQFYINRLLKFKNTKKSKC